MSTLIIILIVINIVVNIVEWIVTDNSKISAILGWGLSLMYYIFYLQAIASCLQ